MVRYQYSGTTLSLFADGRQITLTGKDVESTLELIRKNDLQAIYDKHFKVDVKLQALFGEKNVEVKDGVVFVDGRVISGLLNTRMIQHIENGLPIKPLVAFYRRLQNNPSYQAIQRLFECLDTNHHPLAEDGRFLAWKRISSDFKDLYTHSIDNSIGKKPTVSRAEVDEDMDKTCSKGLHVASFDYACRSYRNGTGQLVEVLVDPADVVAIPRDYNNQKMRVTSYEVIQVCKEERQDRLVSVKGESISPDDYDDYDDYDDDEDDCDCVGFCYGAYDEDDEDEDDDVVDNFHYNNEDKEDEEDEDQDGYCDLCKGPCRV